MIEVGGGTTNCGENDELRTNCGRIDELQRIRKVNRHSPGRRPSVFFPTGLKASKRDKYSIREYD